MLLIKVGPVPPLWDQARPASFQSCLPCCEARPLWLAGAFGLPVKDLVLFPGEVAQRQGWAMLTGDVEGRHDNGLLTRLIAWLLVPGGPPGLTVRPGSPGCIG